MNIFSNTSFNYYNGEDENGLINRLFKQLFEEGKLVYLKPVKHCGKELPVSMLKMNFKKFIDDAKNVFGISSDDICINSGIKEPDTNWLIRNFLTRQGILAIQTCGGAYTSATASDFKIGLFSQPSEIKTKEGYDVGMIIIVDDDLSNYGVNVDTIIHHEYFHAKYNESDNGLMEKSIRQFIDTKDSVDVTETVPLKFEVNFNEELMADQFAEKITGHKIHTMNIFLRYLPAHGEKRLNMLKAGILTLLKEKRHF